MLSPNPAAPRLFVSVSDDRGRTLLELPKIEGDPNTDFGYAWLLPMEERKALMFYCHGKKSGPNAIRVLETGL